MEKNQVQNNQNKEKKRRRFSWLTFVLVICIIELAVSSFNNINKNISFVSKIKGLENKRNEELDKNKQLKSDIENFNSEATLEAMARNNLKMAEKNEILIIMDDPVVEEETDSEKEKKNKQ